MLMLLVVGGSGYHAVVVSSESDRWVSHTHEVLERLEDLHGAVESIVSSYRGFVLTGRESFVKSYNASKLESQRDQLTIRNLTADNPRQKPRLLALGELSNQQIQFAEMLVRLRRTKGMDAARDAVQVGAGEQIQDGMKTLIGEMRDEELRLLVMRDTDAKRRLGQAKAVVILGTILALLIATSAAWSIKREIHGRGMAEEELREGEERFRNLANNISQFAWMADAKGWIFWYNQRWFDYTGTTLEEMAGWGWEKVHHPDHRQRVVDKITRCFRTGEVWEDTFPLRRQDGNYRWFLSRAVPIRDPGGN